MTAGGRGRPESRCVPPSPIPRKTAILKESAGNGYYCLEASFTTRLQMPLKLICVAGARPNFMKIAPLLEALREDPKFSAVLVHTGQHYDDNMSGQFFRELQIAAPDYFLEVGSGSHAQQTAEIMKRFEPVVMEQKPDAVIVVGDVNSTVACALVSKKLGPAVVHVEAGLRSFDRSMPEEINRIVTDAISDLFLVSEESGRQNLLREGAPVERIELVGNLMIDSLRRHLGAAEKSGLFERMNIPSGGFGVVTLHRPANVDDPAQLREILTALTEIARDVPLYWPVHPRTAARLQCEPAALSAGLHLLEPMGYIDFLALLSRSSVVLTDSGGIQEETTALRVTCLTLRNNTERPVTVENGTNWLAGVSAKTILEAWRASRERPKTGRIPQFWDGCAAQRCQAALHRFFARADARAQ